MKRAREPHHHEDAHKPVTRAELMAMLRSARLGVSEHSLRRYQALGLIPAPHAYGRPGRARGVTWGWSRTEAEAIARSIRLIKRYQRPGKRLVQILAEDPELSDVLNVFIQEAQEEAYQEGLEEGRESMRRELTEPHIEPDYEPPEEVE